jgi:hypothetical protein
MNFQKQFNIKRLKTMNPTEDKKPSLLKTSLTKSNVSNVNNVNINININKLKHPDTYIIMPKSPKPKKSSTTADDDIKRT